MVLIGKLILEVCIFTDTLIMKCIYVGSTYIAIQIHANEPVQKQIIFDLMFHIFVKHNLFILLEIMYGGLMKLSQ